MKKYGVVVSIIAFLIMVGLQLYFKQFNLIITAILAIIVMVSAAFNTENIRSLVFDLKNSTFELKQTQKQVEVTTAQFNNTVNAFLSYNLADFQNQGFFDATISWHTGKRFVEEAIKMRDLVGDSNDELTPLINAAKQKVFDLFEMDLYRQFSSISNEIRAAISSGYNDVNIGPRILHPRPVVDFERLRSLNNKLTGRDLMVWKEEVNSLESFYNKCYPREDD